MISSSLAHYRLTAKPPRPDFQVFLFDQEKVWRKRKESWTSAIAAPTRATQK